jgi:hypothetical protein
MLRMPVGAAAFKVTGAPASPVIVTVAACAPAGSVSAAVIAAVMAAEVFLISSTPEIRR